MGGGKALAGGDFEGSGNKKRLAASIVSPDKLEVPSSLSHIIQLSANDTLLHIKPDYNPFKAFSRDGPPPERVYDVETFVPVPVCLVRLRGIHRLPPLHSFLFSP